MKKGIVGLILGAFIIALFTPPAFASPGPPNANAPYQNIKDMKPSLNEGAWGDIKHSPQSARNLIAKDVRVIRSISTGNIQIGILWNCLISYFGHARIGVTVRTDHETSRNCPSVGNSN